MPLSVTGANSSDGRAFTGAAGLGCTVSASDELVTHVAPSRSRAFPEPPSGYRVRL